MSVFSTPLFSLTPENFWRWGRLLLAGGLGFGLLLVIFMTWQGLWVGLLALPVLLLGGVAAWYLFQRPLLNLCVIILGFAAVLYLATHPEFTLSKGTRLLAAVPRVSEVRAHQATADLLANLSSIAHPRRFIIVLGWSMFSWSLFWLFFFLQ